MRTFRSLLFCSIIICFTDSLEAKNFVYFHNDTSRIDTTIFYFPYKLLGNCCNDDTEKQEVLLYSSALIKLNEPIIFNELNDTTIRFVLFKENNPSVYRINVRKGINTLYYKNAYGVMFGELQVDKSESTIISNKKLNEIVTLFKTSDFFTRKPHGEEMYSNILIELKLGMEYRVVTMTDLELHYNKGLRKILRVLKSYK